MAADIKLLGFPGPVNDLATRNALISSFDRRTGNPSWVVEHITPESLAMKGGDRKHSQFLEDEAGRCGMIALHGTQTLTWPQCRKCIVQS
jgi:hypothetical protein